MPCAERSAGKWRLLAATLPPHCHAPLLLSSHLPMHLCLGAGAIVGCYWTRVGARAEAERLRSTSRSSRVWTTAILKMPLAWQAGHRGVPASLLDPPIPRVLLALLAPCNRARGRCAHGASTWKLRHVRLSSCFKERATPSSSCNGHVVHLVRLVAAVLPVLTAPRAVEDGRRHRVRGPARRQGRKTSWCTRLGRMGTQAVSYAGRVRARNEASILPCIPACLSSRVPCVRGKVPEGNGVVIAGVMDV